MTDKATSSGLKAGKLPPDLLGRLLADIPNTDHRVKLGPRVGEDAALIGMGGGRYLAAKTDPITFATDLIGWYLVQINCNDLAVMGATPKWLMTTLLLPEGIAIEEVEEIFQQVTGACSEQGIELVGGHTEVTYGLPRPMAIGVLLGEVDEGAIVLTSGVRDGDAILLTKGVAIEGTAVLAREAGQTLLRAGVSEQIVEAASALLFTPGIGVRREAELLRTAVDVHAMHDPTEGGIASGLAEMAKASGIGLTVDREAISILPECSAICDALGLDPLGLIASGALLMAVAPENAGAALAALEAEGISATVIGHADGKQAGVTLRSEAGVQPMPTFARDELARYFGQ